MRWYLQHFTGALVASLILYLTILFQQGNPIASYERHYSTTSVVPGQVISVNADVERRLACSSTVRRTWIDQSGNVILETVEEVEQLPEGAEPYSTHVTIPPNAPEGVLRQRVKTIFYCNWLQKFLNMGSEFVMPDVIFNVSKKATP